MPLLMKCTDCGDVCDSSSDEHYALGTMELKFDSEMLKQACSQSTAGISSQESGSIEAVPERSQIRPSSLYPSILGTEFY